MSHEDPPLEFPDFIKEEDRERTQRVFYLCVNLYHVLDWVKSGLADSLPPADQQEAVTHFRELRAAGLREFPGFRPAPMPAKTDRVRVRRIRLARHIIRCYEVDPWFRDRRDAQSAIQEQRSASLRLILRSVTWDLHQILLRIQEAREVADHWAGYAAVRYLIKERKVSFFKEYYTGRKRLTGYSPPQAAP